ncbi:hypothetical protein [Thiomonas bhubaneswarensis]|uniref:FlaG protein n=1 Tax=Thiomonas bhubaneswarensis TaxID=339866 RepID=A0A0K6I0X0_9BURK|nr:hypothetical protein [Thiomonas bhubaneswarensis]CUA96721.1 hypothetical protein Ga0061069_104256 [Thiomonas bhubaneswarensis]
MDVQNANGLAALSNKPQLPTIAANPPSAAVGASAAASGPAQPQAAAALQPAAVAKAVDTLQKQVSQQAPSVALSAGLNPDGSHPGQLLVELKDKVTQQVFVRYYVPSEQVVKAAAENADQPMPPGSLLQEKA